MGILVERRGPVEVLTLDRQDALNALSPQMMDSLASALAAAAADPAVRAIVLTGAGRAFCAGADIRAMLEMDVDGARAFAERGHALANGIEASPVPVIAAVNGYALGGGCELALACDIRLASDSARIALPEVSLGILPGWGGTQRLARATTVGFAKEMILTGRQVTADEALARGLVNAVHAGEDLVDQAVSVGERIATRSPAAIARAKRLIDGALGDLAPGLRREIDEFAAAFASPQRHEGMSAFLEKRPPDWSAA